LTSGNSRITLRKATLGDVDAIKVLADTHRHELGFVRRPALVEAINREEIIVAQNLYKVIGFIEYHHRRDDQTTLYHICVEPTYRHQGVGRSLIETLEDEARHQSKRVIRIKCPLNLPANQFYKQVGCSPRGEEQGKRRLLTVWDLFL
jgi:N-acetylglutamate synthase-like GNAT family acetyltransferase